MTNDSTSNRSLKNVNTYIDSLENNATYKEKDMDETNLLPPKPQNLWDKISIGWTNQEDKRQFATINRKLMNLKNFKKELHDILLNQIQ